MTKFQWNGQKCEIESVNFLVPIAVAINVENGQRFMTGKLDCKNNKFYSDENIHYDENALLESAINDFIRNRDAINPDSYISTDPSDYDLKDTIKRNINERSV